MARGADGWWTPDGPVPEGEVDYGYLLDDAEHAAARPALAAPAARRARAVAHLRPRGVRVDRHGAGPAASSPGSVIYELHVGTFTPEGTFDAAARPARPPALDRRRPRRAAAGQRRSTAPTTGATTASLWSAVHEQYGGPAAYQRFVDGCHAAGLGVIQDVVYNHLGPVGQLPAGVRALPQARAPTPGATWSTSTARAATRSAATSSTACGCGSRDYHVDGLRLDAVHALVRRVRRSTCSRRWRSRSRPCRPTCGARSP